jgi:hypothetical protein
MDIGSPIHTAHSDYGQQVYIAPPHTDRQADRQAHHVVHHWRDLDEDQSP